MRPPRRSSLVPTPRHGRVSISLSLSLSLPDPFLKSTLRHPLPLARLRERRSPASSSLSSVCERAHSRTPAASHVHMYRRGEEERKERRKRRRDRVCEKHASRGDAAPPPETAIAYTADAVDAVDAAATADAAAAAAAATPGAARLWVSD